jgi:hypothetical protein
MRCLLFFFLQGSSKKKRGLNTSCGASLWVERDVVSSFSKIFSTTICFFSVFYLIITPYLPLHSLCYSLKTTSIFSGTHQSALRGFLHQNIVWRTETIIVWVRDPGKHDCIVGATMEEFNPSGLQERNDFLQQFSLNLVAYLFIIILNMLSLFWGWSFPEVF